MKTVFTFGLLILTLGLSTACKKKDDGGGAPPPPAATPKPSGEAANGANLVFSQLRLGESYYAENEEALDECRYRGDEVENPALDKVLIKVESKYDEEHGRQVLSVSGTHLTHVLGLKNIQPLRRANRGLECGNKVVDAVYQGQEIIFEYWVDSVETFKFVRGNTVAELKELREVIAPKVAALLQRSYSFRYRMFPGGVNMTQADQQNPVLGAIAYATAMQAKPRATTPSQQVQVVRIGKAPAVPYRAPAPEPRGRGRGRH